MIGKFSALTSGVCVNDIRLKAINIAYAVDQTVSLLWFHNVRIWLVALEMTYTCMSVNLGWICVRVLLCFSGGCTRSTFRKRLKTSHYQEEPYFESFAWLPSALRQSKQDKKKSVNESLDFERNYTTEK